MLARCAAPSSTARARIFNALAPQKCLFSSTCSISASKSKRVAEITKSEQPVLSKLTNAELRNLASITGINNGGSKTDLVTRLVQELKYVRLPSTTSVHRILSVDMGIKNLAFCILDVHESDLPHVTLIDSVATTSLPPRATVKAWTRIDVHQHANEVIEAFDPAHFAKLAYGLVSRTLLPYKPTHVLIERQRYRSGGAAAVQEWTVRVNMFECMLHAVLRTLREESTVGQHSSEALFPLVASVSPQKVSHFFVEREGGSEGKEVIAKKKSRSRVVKNLKTAVAERFVRDALLFDAAVEQTRQAFLTGPTRTHTRRKEADQHGCSGKDEGHAPPGLTKRDDLADCLLQGVAWVQWEVNRRAVLRQGYQELQESTLAMHQNQDP